MRETKPKNTISEPENEATHPGTGHTNEVAGERGSQKTREKSVMINMTTTIIKRMQM